MHEIEHLLLRPVVILIFLVVFMVFPTPPPDDEVIRASRPTDSRTPDRLYQ